VTARRNCRSLRRSAQQNRASACALQYEADVEMVKTGFGALAVILVVTGIAGTIYKLVAPDGWIIAAFGRSLSAGFAALLAIVAVVAFAWLSGAAAMRQRNRYADVFVYTFAVAGFLFLAHYWLKGSF
jgi:hypothetical protein